MFSFLYERLRLRLAGDFTLSVLTVADQGLLIILLSLNLVPIKKKSRASQYNFFFRELLELDGSILLCCCYRFCQTSIWWMCYNDFVDRSFISSEILSDAYGYANAYCCHGRGINGLANKPWNQRRSKTIGNLTWEIIIMSRKSSLIK